MATGLRLGFRVYICATPCTSPQSYFHTHTITQTYPNTMGFTVTASHNPAGYVGAEVCLSEGLALSYYVVGCMEGCMRDWGAFPGIKFVVPTPEGHKVHAIGMDSGPMGGLAKVCGPSRTSTLCKPIY